jgi:hypothetical protein
MAPEIEFKNAGAIQEHLLKKAKDEGYDLSAPEFRFTLWGKNGGQDYFLWTHNCDRTLINTSLGEYAGRNALILEKLKLDKYRMHIILDATFEL